MARGSICDDLAALLLVAAIVALDVLISAVPHRQGRQVGLRKGNVTPKRDGAHRGGRVIGVALRIFDSRGLLLPRAPFIQMLQSGLRVREMPRLALLAERVEQLDHLGQGCGVLRISGI